MQNYFFDLAGEERDETGTSFDDPGEARNAAIRFLGEYLTHHPDFAYDGQWRVDVLDQDRQLLFHIVVATVSTQPIESLR